MNRPERVVLLGKKGFIASHLRRHLGEQGIPLEAVGRDEVDLTHPAAAAKLSDIVRETDKVVIASALTPDKGRNFHTLMENLRMGENLCELFEKKSCAHVIYLSSDAVYDAHQTPLDEDSSRQPMDFHALMHTAREMMLDSVLKPRGIPYCVLRPVNIYGLGDTHNSYGPNRFVREAFGQQKIIMFGRGEERRCHLYVEDAVRLITACIERKTVGSLNLAPTGTITFMKLAETIQAACPFKVEFEFKPRTAPIIHRPYKLTQVFRFIYNLGRHIDPIVHRPYSTTKLRRIFPDFSFTPMQEAINRYVSVYGASLGERGSRP